VDIIIKKCSLQLLKQLLITTSISGACTISSKASISILLVLFLILTVHDFNKNLSSSIKLITTRLQ